MSRVILYTYPQWLHMVQGMAACCWAACVVELSGPPLPSCLAASWDWLWLWRAASIIKGNGFTVEAGGRGSGRGRQDSSTNSSSVVEHKLLKHLNSS